MDAGILTTLGCTAAMMLTMLAIFSWLRNELRSELKEQIQEIKADLQLLNDRVSDLLMEMRGLKEIQDKQAEYRSCGQRRGA